MKKILSLLIFIFLLQPLKAEEKFIVCENSIEMFDWAFAFVEKAEQSIEFAPCYFGGELFQKMMSAFEKQMKKYPKLQIYLLFEATFLEPQDKELLALFEKKYARQFHYMLTTRVVEIADDLRGISNHLKMLIVDGTYYALGGSNYDYVIASEGTHAEPKRRKQGVVVAKMLPSGGRDQDIVGSGPIAAQLRELFYKSYCLWRDYNYLKRFSSKNPDDFAQNSYFKKLAPKSPYVEKFEESKELISVDSSKVQLILGGPHQKTNAITERFKKLISSSKEQICIGNLYFAPVAGLMQSLQQAARAGVEILVVTNGINDRAPPYTVNFAYANRIHFLPILYGKEFEFWERSKCEKSRANRAEFFEYYVDDIVYHKKVMIVDKRYFAIGCYNFNEHSDKCDYELALVIESAEVAAKAMEVFQNDMDHSRKIERKQIKDWYFDPLVHCKATLQKKGSPLI